MLTQERLEAFDEASAELARRLEEDDYPSPFDSLSDWHLLRALAIHRPELILLTTTWWTRNPLMRTDQPSPLNGRRVLVAVGGGIAAVKTPLLVSALVAGAGAVLSQPVALLW